MWILVVAVLASIGFQEAFARNQDLPDFGPSKLVRKPVRNERAFPTVTGDASLADREILDGRGEFDSVAFGPRPDRGIEAEAADINPEVYRVDDAVDRVDYYYYSAEVARLLPPPCIHNESDLVFIGGYFSVEQTFYNCLANVLGSTFIPTFWNGSYHGQLPIYSSIIMNSLVGIVEVDSTVELTFDLTLQWRDERFDMPGVWERIPKGFIDLTSTILQNDSINIWRPNIVFPDAIEIDQFAFDFRLNRNNYFYYQVSYHMILVQPEFDFARYPADRQNINIRFADAEFETRELIFVPTNMEFTTLPDGEYGFDANPIWDFDKYSYFAYVDAAYDNSYNVYQIEVIRRAYGVVIRLVLPMALLIVLGSITFWVSYEHRVDVTITILLAMSALYITILQNIPLVGYLTNVDHFVFWMYFMLVCVTVLHQTYATLNEKLDRWPLRLIYLRLIEVSGRVFVLPAVVIYFVVYIPVSSNPAYGQALMAVAITVAAIILIRELFGVRSNVYDAMRNLTIKCNSPDLRVSDLSFVEALAMNLFHFKTLSTSKLLISDYLHKHGAFPIKVRKPLHLKNLSSLVSLLEGRFQAEKTQGRRKVESQSGLRLSRIMQPAGSASGGDGVGASDMETGATTTDGAMNENGLLQPRRKGWELFLMNGQLENAAFTEDDFTLVQNEMHSASHGTPAQQGSSSRSAGVEMEMTTRPPSSRMASAADSNVGAALSGEGSGRSNRSDTSDSHSGKGLLSGEKTAENNGSGRSGSNRGESKVQAAAKRAKERAAAPRIDSDDEV